VARGARFLDDLVVRQFDLLNEFVRHHVLVEVADLPSQPSNDPEGIAQRAGFLAAMGLRWCGATPP
jgi:hypothetical protein